MNFKHADKFNRQVVCPYSNVKSCQLAQQKIQGNSRAITFECIKCKRLMCGNFRYSDDANLCWPCGLKMHQHEIDKLKPQDDLT